MAPQADPHTLPGNPLVRVLPGAWLRYAPRFLDANAADALFGMLLDDIAWEQHHVHLFGRKLPAPRLSCWVGDAGAAYTYSGTRFEPRPWPAALTKLREHLQARCNTHFNSVLANLYRDGQDAMAWHSDDEPELGPQPLIASLSLGATRRFVLRPRVKGSSRAQDLPMQLTHGSLLLMGGDCQCLYRHALPRTRCIVAPRINLTFRQVRSAERSNPTPRHR